MVVCPGWLVCLWDLLASEGCNGGHGQGFMTRGTVMIGHQGHSGREVRLMVEEPESEGIETGGLCAPVVGQKLNPIQLS